MKIAVRKGKVPAAVARGPGGDDLSIFMAYAGRKPVGRIHLKDLVRIKAVTWIEVDPEYRKRGVATKLYEAAARAACNEGKSLASDTTGNRAPSTEAFWRKQLAKGRAEHREDRIVLFCPAPSSLARFGQLPAHGRIPMPQVQRAMKMLGRKVKTCRITPALLAEGMAVEREHRDVTHLNVGTTARIAASHLCERRDYYKRIKRFVEPRRK